jgi:hypothetical protein
MRLRNLVLGSLIGVLSSGCATSHYFSDRGRDALDVLTLQVGGGYGAKVRVGPFQIGWMEDMIGLAGLRGGTFFNVSDCINYGKDGHHSQYADTQRIVNGTESFDFSRIGRGKTFVAGTEVNGLTTPFFHRVDNRYKAPHYYTQIELVFGAGLTFRQGINLGELLDFVLGWTSLDIYRDDMSATPRKDKR